MDPSQFMRSSFDVLMIDLTVVIQSEEVEGILKIVVSCLGSLNLPSEDPKKKAP